MTFLMYPNYFLNKNYLAKLQSKPSKARASIRQTLGQRRAYRHRECRQSSSHLQGRTPRRHQ